MKRGSIVCITALVGMPIILPACVSVGKGGGTVTGQWLAFGPVETIGAGRSYHTGMLATDVATDGRGRWILVVSSSSAAQGEPDLLVSVSGDNGGSWTQPAALHPYFLSDALNDTTPHITTGGKGTWIVTWNAWPEVPQGQPPRPIAMYSRSTDNGATWSQPARFAEEPYRDQYQPALATDGRRTWICVWLGFGSWPEAGSEDVYSYTVVTLSTDDGLTWSAPTPLYRGLMPGRVALYDPAAGFDGVRAFTVAWTQVTQAPNEHRILAVTSRDSGRTWSNASVIDNAYGMHLRLAYGADQACVAIWESGRWVNSAWEPAGLVTSRSDDLAAAWSRPTPITPAGEAASNHFPRLATDGRGNWMAVWQRWSYTDHDADVWVSVSRDNGRRWIAPALVYSDDPAHRTGDHYPVVDTDGRGRWLVQWCRETSSEGMSLLYRLDDVPRASWRGLEVGIGIGGSIPL